tara:strand:+ start:428 stop:1201 length:774 start_codon:yes stop_codon:yes gene_type:complete
MSQNIDKLFNYKNKIVLITGSNGQVGKSLVKLFLDLGSIVYGLDIASNQIKEKNFFYKKVDISNTKKIEVYLKYIVKKNKKIDIIINNAGYSVFSKFYKRSEKEFNNTINVNLKGPINIINSYYKIHKSKKLKNCNIVNIGSIYGSLSPDFRIYGKNDNFNSEIYGATKAGVIQLTKYYSVILSKHNININCLSPGGIFNDDKPQERNFVKKYSSRIPKNRMAKIDDIYTGILFLTSDKSNYVSGQNLMIDGGLSSW